MIGNLSRVCFLLAPMLVPSPLGAQDSFVGKTVEHWREQLSSSQAQSRVEAAWAIAQLASNRGSDSASQVRIEDLTKLTHDADATARYWGVMGLSGYARRGGATESDKTAAVNALSPLLDDKSSAPRIAAAEALCILGQTEKALPVIVAAMNDPQDSVRIQAVAALEKIGPAARPAVGTLQKATTDSSEYVKRISERSLVTLGVAQQPAEAKAKAKKGKAKAKSQS